MSPLATYIKDKDKILSFSDDMDSFDIEHNVNTTEYGQNLYDTSSEYVIRAAKEPTSIMGKLRKSLIDITANHKDRGAVGARAVIALNEIDRVNQSDISEQAKKEEILAIHDDMDKYLSSKGIYTKSQQTLNHYEGMLNLGLMAVGGNAVTNFGAKALLKGILRYSITSAGLRFGAFPFIKYASTLETGQQYEYKPLSLVDLMGVKTEQAGLKVGTDIIEMVGTGLISYAPDVIQRSKITAVIDQAKPKLEALFRKYNITIPKEGLTTDFVLQMTKQSPELGDAIVQAAGRLPFYKALGERGSVPIPKFSKGDIINLSGEEAKVLSIKGQEIILDIAGQQIIKNVSELAAEMLPIELRQIPEKAIESEKLPAVKGFGWKPRGFVESIQEELPEIKVSGQYIPRSTDKLAIKAKNLIKENLSIAEKIAKTEIDDKAIAIGAELLKYYSEQAEQATNETIKDALYNKAAELGNDLAVRLTNLGRSVQAASILGRMTPEGQIRFAAKTIQKYNEDIEKTKGGFLGLKRKIPELTPEQTKDIIDNIKAIEAMPDGEDKAIRFRELQNYISDLVPTSSFQKVVSIWKAGLLTGLKTSGVNILSNFSHAFVSEVLKDIPATAVDSVVALFTKKRAVTFTTKGIFKGLPEGFEKGMRYLKTGYDERNVAIKLDYKRVNFGKSKFAKGLQRYEETIFRILGAEDQPFFYGAKARSIYEQALVQTKNSGLKGKEAKDFFNNLLENPTDEMLVYAVSDAETAVFQNKTKLGEAAKQLQKIPVFEFIIPFSRTPSAVAMQILNYSPYGALKTIFVYAGKGKFNQREFSKGMGRALLGLPILALGAYLLRKDKITLESPKGESEMKMWELEGRKPNSIKIGDKWRSVQGFGPLGNLLLVGAHFQNAFNQEGTPTKAIAIAHAKSLTSFSEQTFLTGISQATMAITEPERGAPSFSRRFISSFVPTLVADIARGVDTKYRRTEDIPQALMERIPLLRESLEPQIDILGREKMRKENFLEVLADPTRPLTEINEPITKELRRLRDAEYTIATTQVGDKTGYKILTPKQNTELWQRAGQIAYEKLSALMSISTYNDVPDDIKVREINKIFKKSKLIARTEKLIEITNGLQEGQLRKKLSEAKEDGLMNREVHNYFLRFR